MVERKDTPTLHGMLAEFDDPDALLAAAKASWREGYRNLDAYSPLPIHGLAEAIGFHKNSVALFTLIGGLTGAATLFMMQVIGHVWHYPYLVGGRELFSWPSFIVITFEGMILFASFTCGIAMLLLNGLPQPYHPVMTAANFDRATSDRFFLCIEAHDPRYNRANTRTFLEGLDPKPLNIEEVVG